MAALRRLRTALASLSFRRLWEVVGTADDHDERSAADSVPLVHDAPPPPVGDSRTFRLLGSGSPGLFDREEVASGPATMAANAAARPSRSTVKPLAGVIAWVVAAAAGMTFLFPPGEAEAYHYYTDGGHFDHARKEQIVMNLGSVGYMPTIISTAWTRTTWNWSAGSDVKITTNWEWTSGTDMTIRALWYEDNTDTRHGYYRRWSPGDRSHWIHEPAVLVWINLAEIEREAEDEQQDWANATAAHEVGHALGLDHTGINGCSGDKWNEGMLQDNTGHTYGNCNWTTPQGDDIKGVNQLYLTSSK